LLSQTHLREAVHGQVYQESVVCHGRRARHRQERFSVFREESGEARISAHCGDLQVIDFAGLTGVEADYLAN
jgi:hypothetical protein